MGKRFRISVIGKINAGISRGDIEKLMAPKLAAKGLLEGDALQWISVPSQAGQDRYVKLSAVVTAENLDDAWNLKASRSFAAAGYGQMAWKITPVASDDPDGENTTCSIPADLFEIEAETGESETATSMPPEPFGSDGFWEWLDDMPPDKPGEGNPDRKDYPSPPLKEANDPFGHVETICAACGKIREKTGRWRQHHFDLWSSSLSHGICPECAKRLYPDLYRD